MNQAASGTRLSSRWLWPARLAWSLVLLLAIWKLVLGTPLIYAEKQTICIEACAESNSPTVEDAAALHASGISLAEYASLSMLFFLLETVIWMGTGVLIFILRSDDWMALLTSAMMILFATGPVDYPIMRAYPSLGWLALLGFSLQNAFLFLFVGLFPSGRFVPRWMRWFWIPMVVIALVGDFLVDVFPAAAWIWVLWFPFLILGPYSQIYRYRKASSLVERLQTWWVVFGFSAMAGLILMGAFLEQVGILPDIVIQDFYFGLAGLMLPICIAISVLRFHLWDIDVIIRKTLVYGALSLTLGLVFFGAVTLLQSLFVALSGQRSAVAAVISTLFIAALFSPLRRRIQNDIDRRFFRKKYDAEKIVEAFSAGLRQELDPEQLSERLLAVVEETLQPERVSLWLREGGPKR